MAKQRYGLQLITGGYVLEKRFSDEPSTVLRAFDRLAQVNPIDDGRAANGLRIWDYDLGRGVSREELESRS